MGCKASKSEYTISGTNESITATAQMLMEAKKLHEQRTGPDIRRMVVVNMPSGRTELRPQLVLLDMQKMGFLTDVDEDNEMIRGNLVVYRENADDCKKLCHYLNHKFGPVATMGRMNPLIKQNQKERWMEQFSTRGHIAIVQDAEGEFPNQQYAAYERLKPNKDTGMPSYRRVDIESRLRYARNQRNPANQSYRDKHYDHMNQSAKGMPQVKNKFGFNQVNAIKTDQYLADEEEREHITAETAVTGKGVAEIVVGGREALAISYTDKARKFREVSAKHGKVSKGLMNSFKRETIRDLIKIKGKVWSSQRQRMWYKRQLDGRKQIAEWKQQEDPTILAQPDSIWVKAQANC